MDTITAFNNIEMRVGTIIRAEVFKEVKMPAYKLWINFGDFGIKKTSAQVTALYNVEELMGKQVVAVVNFEPKQIANFMSECLILGAVGDNNLVTLLSVDKPVENGLRVS
ncbi:tRNA-binding protein [Pedobacter alpinus]|uniref:tRNA-binding protein n=1 Tax=Pedobacter alpinus TaxID=1590643 RepID=A0ABW5TVK5_9SPHI